MKHPRKYYRAINNRGMALIASIVMAVFLGIMISVAFMGMDMELKESASRELSQDSFNTAESGLERAIFELRQNNQWVPPLQPPFSQRVCFQAQDQNCQNQANLQDIQGTYTLQVNPAPNWGAWPSVFVRSIGVDRFGRNPRTILARVIVQSPTQFLAFTMGTLTVTSGMIYDHDLFANRVNIEADPTQGNINITGSVSFMSQFNSNVALAVNADGSRTGNGVNITGGVAQSQAVAFTGIDQAFYSNLAAQDGRVFNQATTLAGNIDNILGNVRNGVVFVNGDLHISGTYNQNLTFVATGNIFIDGDLTPPGGITPVGTAAAAQLGLLSVSNVIIPENAPQNINIEAYVLAERGQFTAAGTNAKGTLTFRGSMAVGSNPIAVSAIDLNTYVTRNFQYNDSFANNNLAIPSLQSIVNVVDWNEI